MADAHVGRARALLGGPAPTLGQHNDEVLRDELGVTTTSSRACEAEHVIGDVPRSSADRARSVRRSAWCPATSRGVDQIAREEFEDALVDGDVPFQRGTAQAALRHRNFRIIYFGMFASNIGTWMQNVVLGAYAPEAHRFAFFVGLVFFAQLGPLLFLSTLGGLLADIVDRRRFLVGAAARAARIVVRARGHRARRHIRRAALIVIAVFAIGIANALGAPGPERDPAHVRARAKTSRARSRSLSVQMNLSRVIGPIIGAGIYYALERGAGVRDQRRHLPVRRDRVAVGEVPAAHQRPGGRARLRPAACRASASRGATRSSPTSSSRCSRSPSSRSRSWGSCR